MKKRILAITAILALSTGALAGCGKEGATANAASNETEAKTPTAAVKKDAADDDAAEADAPAEAESVDEVKTIYVGVGTSPVPFSYYNEAGELEGYEYEIFTKIDELLPQYEFVYEAADTKTLLIGLDTNTYDVVAHHLDWTQERADKYLFSNYGNYNQAVGYVVVGLPGRTDMSTEADLQGKTLELAPTSSFTSLVQLYNEKEAGDDPINIQFSEATNEQLCADILNGVVDGTITDGWMFDQWKKTFAADLEAYGADTLFEDLVDTASGRFLYNYGSEQLRDEIDEALLELLHNGTAKELSLKYFGIDHASID